MWSKSADFFKSPFHVTLHSEKAQSDGGQERLTSIRNKLSLGNRTGLPFNPGFHTEERVKFPAEF